MARKSGNVFEVDMQFPVEGVNDQRAFFRQRSGTTPGALNVRVFEPGTDRARGGQRPGLTRYFDDEAVGDYSIQCIDRLVSNDVVATTTSVGHFVYGLTSGNGFGVGDSAGTSVFTAGNVASFQFACSCWDDDGNVYVTTVNTTTGATKVYKYTAAGTLATNFPVTSITVTTGSLRSVCGMCVIGSYLYFACTQGGVSRIHRVHTTTGALSANWKSSDVVYSTMVFSTSAVQAIAKCGKILGVEVKGTGSDQGFILFNTDNNTHVYRSYGGTAANNKSTVVSDGIAFFYTIASVSSSIVKKIGLGGVIEWSSTAADTPTGLTYDFSTGKLVATVASSPSVRVLSLTTGSQTSSADPNSVTNYSWIDCDNAGFFTLYRDGVGSNDVYGVNSTFSTVWGPTTFANTTHSGASVNKGKVLSNISGGNRKTRAVLISNGECRIFTTDGATAITNGASFHASAPVIWSAQNGLNLFFVDGTVYKYLKSTTNAITAWSPTAGSLPVDDLSARARLIATWRGRTVLSGLPRNPQNFYMSKQFDPFDWDYSPATQTAQQAFSGNDSMSGQAPDIVNCLISYNDDVMIVGCDHSIWQITGDPMAGGQMDNVSQTIGMAWGRPFALDPSGQVYFFANHGAVYKMTPGSTPVPVSQQIKRRLENIDMSANLIQLTWDLVAQGLWVWITPHDRTSETTHYFWEERTNAWFPVQFGETDYNPLSVHVYDGDLPEDRIIMLGGMDGRIRYLNNAAVTDDGTEIESYVFIGPLMTKQIDEIMLEDLQATLGEDSKDVRFDVYVGKTAEQAYNSAFDDDGEPVDGVVHGTWQSGRNGVSMIRRSEFAAFVKLSATDSWSLERITARYRTSGPVRQRWRSKIRSS